MAYCCSNSWLRWYQLVSKISRPCFYRNRALLTAYLGHDFQATWNHCHDLIVLPPVDFAELLSTPRTQKYLPLDGSKLFGNHLNFYYPALLRKYRRSTDKSVRPHWSPLKWKSTDISVLFLFLFFVFLHTLKWIEVKVVMAETPNTILLQAIINKYSCKFIPTWTCTKLLCGTDLYFGYLKTYKW